MADVILLSLLAAALVGLFYGWGAWRKQLRLIQAPSWRRTTLTIGLLAVTLQALLFALTWTPLSRLHALLLRAENAEYLLLALALPCIFAWKGRARWWLLTSSVGFGIGTFFSVLAEIAY
jgi:hypothetical protein